MPKGDKDILKADIDDGYSPIANLLLEALAMARLSGMEKGAVLLLWRKTYGWHKSGKRLKEWEIPLHDWATGLNVDETKASKVLSSLAKHNIISRNSLGPGKSYTYSMNTKIFNWNGDCLNKQALSLTRVDVIDNPCPNRQATLVENDKTTLVENDKTTLVENDNPSVPTKETLNKSIKETLNKPQEIIADIFKTYENDFGRLTVTTTSMINDLIDEYSAEWVRKAMDEAIKSSAKTIRFLEVVLGNWKTHGLGWKPNQKPEIKQTPSVSTYKELE
jgi:phage replication O-like protein O